jgi:hypothetical protein
MPKNVLVWQSASARSTPSLPLKLSIKDRAGRPIAHVTRQVWLADLLSKGDTIWIVGRYKQISNASVSLIGCIVIETVTVADGLVTFMASAESQWLPWNDMTGLIPALRFQTKTGEVSVSTTSDISQQVQTSRELAPTCVEALEKLAAELFGKPRLFLSYMWRDATSILPYLLPVLTNAGFGVWVDRWSGPRRLKDGKNHHSDEALRALFNDAIIASEIVVVLEGEGIDKNQWTAFELAVAQAANKAIVKMDVASIRNHWRDQTLSQYVAENIRCTLERDRRFIS